MSKKFLIGVLLLVVPAVFVGVSFLKKNDPVVPVALAPATPMSSPVENLGVVDANNQFAFEFYSKLKEKEENIFFSPLSISTALAMTYEGARGETARQIQAVFHFPSDEALLREAFADLLQRLNQKEAEYKLQMANALWIKKERKLLDEYVEAIKKYYGGQANNVDFAGAGEEVRTTINRWVEEKTNDKIKGLFPPPNPFDENTRLVLVNAIYFKGLWSNQFNKAETKPEDFRMPNNQTAQVSMMRQTDEETVFPYFETDDLQILEIPYKGDDLSMLFLLPKKEDLKKMESLLTAAQLKSWYNLLSEHRVDVYLPKFTLNSRYLLNESLTALGMPAAFNEEEADFSGMDGTKELLLGVVLHQAFVEIDEEGSEAAAVTAVTLKATGMPSDPPPTPVFRADHPFLFVILERKSGNILFLGRFAKPL